MEEKYQKQVCFHCRQIKPCVQVGKRFLCEQHKDLKQYKVKQAKVYELKRTPIITKSKPKQISIKQKSINTQKTKLYEQLREQREQICTGCGTTQGLTHSHLIPVSQRKDLETNPTNITYHCMGCHTIWEHDIRGRTRLNDYSINVEKIRQLDEVFYNKIINKLNEII